MTRTVLLVRHPPVSGAYRGVCYGASDVPLGPDGLARMPTLVDDVLALGRPAAVWHSGLSRCRVMAEAIAERCGRVAAADVRLRERHFGAWELRTWDDIHAETGDAMMGMVTDPAGWRPPGGETTFGLRDRVLAWHAALPAEGLIVAVTHGGPIAALVGTLRGLPASDWPALIPPPGGLVAWA